jgi:hypothetical protein
VPGFIIGMVNVQITGTAAAPFVDVKGCSGRGDGQLIFQPFSLRWNNNGISHWLTPVLSL